MPYYVLVAEKTGEAVYANVPYTGVYRLPKERWGAKDIDVCNYNTIPSDFSDWDEVMTVNIYRQTHDKVKDAPDWQIRSFANDAATVVWNDILLSSDALVLDANYTDGDSLSGTSQKRGRFSDAAFDYFMDAMPDCAERDERIGRCFEYGTESEDINLDAAEFWYKKAEEKGSDFAKDALKRIEKTYVSLPKEAVLRYEEPTEKEKGKAFVAFPVDEFRSIGGRYASSAYMEIPLSEPLDMAGDRVSVPVRNCEKYRAYSSGSLLAVDERDNYMYSEFLSGDVKYVFREDARTVSGALSHVPDDAYRAAAADIKKQVGKKIRATVDASCLTVRTVNDKDVYMATVCVDRKDGSFSREESFRFYIAPEDVKLSPDFKKAALSLPYGAVIRQHRESDFAAMDYGISTNTLAKQHPYKSFDSGHDKGGK